MPKIKNKIEKYAKPVSLYPLKPEDALDAFMKIDPKKFARRERVKKNGK